jgi:hypothetical protein
MPTLTHIHRRKLISSLAVALVLLGGSFGVAKSAAAPPPERAAPVPALQEHFAHLEVESGEVRNPLEVASWAVARPEGRMVSRHGRARGSRIKVPRLPGAQASHQIS